MLLAPQDTRHRFLLVVLLLLRLLVSFTIVRGLSVDNSGLDTSGTVITGTTSRNVLISVADAIETFDTLTFVDASWYHKGDRNGLEDYLRGPRIANSVFFDLSSSSSTTSTIMRCHQPTELQFASIMDRLGITNDSNIVVYGQPGAFFLPRAWFTIRHVMGHESCYLLDGTMADWEAAGGSVEYNSISKEYIHTPIEVSGRSSTLSYQPRYNPDLLIALNDMKQFVQDRAGIILDARGSSFRNGHMPGAIHIPYSSLQDEQGRLKSTEQMASILTPKLLLDDHYYTADVVITCGTGVSACTIFLALQQIGYLGRVRVYDGSWSEWNTYDDLPKVIP